VREFVEKAFAEIGREVAWRGAGIDEKGVDARSGETLVEIDRRYFRPTEVEYLLGDASKARAKLGWKHTIGFDDLVREMVAADVETVKREHNALGRRAAE